MMSASLTDECFLCCFYLLVHQLDAGDGALGDWGNLDRVAW